MCNTDWFLRVDSSQVLLHFISTDYNLYFYPTVKELYSFMYGEEVTMFKIVLSNLTMMINTSTFSKGLIIFLVSYLAIISTVTSNTETEEKSM